MHIYIYIFMHGCIWIYICIDIYPYKKNSQAFRLPFQSKSQDKKLIEGSILNVEIPAKNGNYLITQLSSQIDNIFDIEKVNYSLYATAKYKCIKREKKIHDTSHYDMLDVLLVDLPYNNKILQNYSQNDILKIVRKHNITKTEDVEIFNIYLNTIPNPKDGRYKLSYLYAMSDDDTTEVLYELRGGDDKDKMLVALRWT